MAEWKAPLVICGVNINAIKEPGPLHQLLQQCKDFDDKNKIFARLMDIMPGGAASGDGGGGGRLLPLVYDQIRSLQGADRRVSEGTLQSATRRAQRSQTTELDTFLDGLKTNLTGDGHAAATAATADATTSANATTGRLSPRLLSEVVSMLDRVRSSLQIQSRGDGGGEGDDGRVGSGGKSSELLQLIDRLQSKLKIMTQPQKELPLVPLRRAAILGKRRRAHTTGITRDELMDIRRSLEISQQQERQNQQNSTLYFSPSVETDPPRPLLESRIQNCQNNVIISPSEHTLSSIANNLNICRLPGKTVKTFQMGPDILPEPAIVRKNLDASLRPFPHPRLENRKSRHTIGSSKEDFATIRLALNAAIIPASPVMDNQMLETVENGSQKTLETQKELVPPKTEVPKSHPQFSCHNRFQVHHRNDANDLPSTDHPGLHTPKFRSNSQFPCSLLAAVLPKQATKEYLKDSTNISRDQVMDGRLFNHKTMENQDGVAKYDASLSKSLDLLQPGHEIIQTCDPVAGHGPPIIETCASPTQYTCSIVTQETQTIQLPSSSRVLETKYATSSGNNLPIWARQGQIKTVPTADSSQTAGGGRPAWAQNKYFAGRLSLDGSLLVPRPNHSQPVWSYQTKKDTSPVDSWPSSTQKETSHSKTASESTLPSDKNHISVVDVPPSNQEEIFFCKTDDKTQHSLASPGACTSLNVVDHGVTSSSSQHGRLANAQSSKTLPVQFSDSTRLPWTQQGRSGGRTTSVSRIANVFGSNSLDVAPPTLARQSRLEKTRSLYSAPSVDQKTIEKNITHANLAYPQRQNFQHNQHQRPTLSSGGLAAKHCKVLERSKSEEHIGGRQYLAESLREEQLRRCQELQQCGNVNGMQTQNKPRKHSAQRQGINQHQSYQLCGQQALTYKQHQSHTGENMLQLQTISSNQNYQQQQDNEQSAQNHENTFFAHPSFQPHPPVQSQTHQKPHPKKQPQHTYANALPRQDYISKKETNDNPCRKIEFIPVTADESASTVNACPLWAKSGSSSQGKVRQRAATLEEVSPMELPHQPKDLHLTQQSAHILSRPLLCKSGSVYLKSYHGPITDERHAAQPPFDGAKSHSAPTSAPSISSWLPTNQSFHFQTAPLPRSPILVENKLVPVELPPQYPRSSPHQTPDSGYRDVSSTYGAGRGRQLGLLQRSSSSDMLRFGVTTKPFEARLDAANAERQKQRLQNFFKKREEERENERLAQSFEDLLDGLDEENLPPVKFGGVGGSGGGKTAFRSVGSMPHALAKSATVGDLQPTQRAASMHEGSMFARKQRACENTIGTSMAVGMVTSNAQPIQKPPAKQSEIEEKKPKRDELALDVVPQGKGTREVMLFWVQCRLREYKNIKVENFSTCWADGIAFCALIHHFFPDAFDFSKLNPNNRRYNFDLAFRTADQRAGIFPLLDANDMVAMEKPDWKSVFAYIQSIYAVLK